MYMHMYMYNLGGFDKGGEGREGRVYVRNGFLPAIISSMVSKHAGTIW